MARPLRSFAHEAPHDLVKRIPVGSKLFRRDGRGRGPWVARTPFGPGVKTRKVYVGSDANKTLVERAWAIVGAELAQLEAVPEVRKLRELEALSKGPALARAAGIVGGAAVPEVAQMALRFAAAGRAGPRRPKE